MLDINSCSELELSALPGIGPILAKKAIRYRMANNGYESVDEFYKVLLLKEHIIHKLENRLTLQSCKCTPNAKVSARTVDF